MLCLDLTTLDLCQLLPHWWVNHQHLCQARFSVGVTMIKRPSGQDDVLLNPVAVTCVPAADAAATYFRLASPAALCDLNLWKHLQESFPYILESYSSSAFG